jgi:1,2-diacylglycerol 3-alpha-glucosyltransferase
MKLFSKTHQQAQIPSGDAPLRIGFFADTYAPQVNGISVSLQLLTQTLRAAGHQVTIFAPRFPDYADADPDVHRIPAVSYRQMPAFYISLPGTPHTSLEIRRCTFDVLHVHSPLSTGVMAYVTAKTKHAPLIYTYHTAITDFVSYLKISGNVRPVQQAARWFSTATANRADHIVAPSVKVRDLLLTQRVNRPVEVIPNGIDLARFQQPSQTSRFRRQLGLSFDTPLLLSVGRLATEKSLPLLIDAFPSIAAHIPNAHLIFAGDGDARGELEARAAASGCGERIHFLGMVSREELPDLLHEADLFLSSSTCETQCVAMAEAIAAGLPIVAVSDRAFTGMFANGINGYVAPQDAAGFAAAVCNLLLDAETLQRFGRNSLELSRNFSVEAQADALVALYREAIFEKANTHKRSFSIRRSLTRSPFKRSIQ